MYSVIDRIRRIDVSVKLIIDRVSQICAIQIQLGKRACNTHVARESDHEDLPPCGGQEIPQGRSPDLQRRRGRGRAESGDVEILGSESRHLHRKYAEQLLQVIFSQM